MELNEIKILVDKYFDGETSLKEESIIADYLASCTELPEELIAVKMMFEAMGLLSEAKAPEAKIERKFRLRLPHIATAVATAACIMLAIIVTNREIYTEQQPMPAIICYVDGSLVSDQTAAENEARRILGNMNQNVTLAMASIEKVNIFNKE